MKTRRVPYDKDSGLNAFGCYSHLLETEGGKFYLGNAERPLSYELDAEEQLVVLRNFFAQNSMPGEL